MNEPATFRDFLVGFSGTSFAFLTENLNGAAAAGFGTCVWMITQTVLAILKHRKENKTRREK